ncbi:MAG: photosynthetic reaction center cytochrome PufC [Myxococcota bacterium]
MRFLPFQVAAGLGALGIGIWSFGVAMDVRSVQRGYDGVGMEHVTNETTLTALEEANAGVPADTAHPEVENVPMAGDIYENVQVLGHLNTVEFTRIMTMMTQWVSPPGSESYQTAPEGIDEQGCNYCHNPANMASDEKYTKHVSRRMIQMTQHINENWGTHVGGAGVNCWTCHRGNNVPKYIWFEDEGNPNADRMVGGGVTAMNYAGNEVGLASLPNTAYETFLNAEATNIRVVGPTALPTTNTRTIKQTEHTYGLMMHMSNALGVNCTYCHNSRAMAEWGQSPKTRTTAWYGIRMVRNLNQEYLASLNDEYLKENESALPKIRLGEHAGDSPKANCYTCHQGAYKPVLGRDMISMYPSLQKQVEYKPRPKVEIEGDHLEISEKVFFETGSSTISERSYRLLDVIAEVLAANPTVLKMEIQGHTDNTGVAEENLTLSEARAAAVQAYLVEKGVDAERLTAQGYGQTQPRAGNDTDEGRDANRRVEFIIVESAENEPLPEPEPTPAPE